MQRWLLNIVRRRNWALVSQFLFTNEIYFPSKYLCILMPTFPPLSLLIGRCLYFNMDPITFENNRNELLGLGKCACKRCTTDNAWPASS